MQTKFSIIVVCYNPGNKLKQTINSILKQTYCNYEVIVKDGMSTDASLQTIPLEERILVTSYKDAGIYDAMNQAIRQASGEYLYFLNCGDTFYDNEVLEQMNNFIKEHPDRGIYYGDTFNETSNVVVPILKKTTAFTCYRHIPCHQACFYQKELCKEKEYNTNYKIRADYDHFLWCYFVKKTKLIHVGFSIANYEGGGFSESRENKERDRQEHKEITKRYMSKKQLFAYQAFMLVTLMPVRRFLANNKHFSKIYQGMKQLFYGIQVGENR